MPIGLFADVIVSILHSEQQDDIESLFWKYGVVLETPCGKILVEENRDKNEIGLVIVSYGYIDDKHILVNITLAIEK